MLTKSAVLDPIDVTSIPTTTPAPMTSDVEYPAGLAEIRVPVFPLPDHPEGKQVFTPPFVLPLGSWTVIYTVQPPTQGYVFDHVDNDNQAANAFIDANGQVPGVPTQWSTTINNKVLDVNKLKCTIFLRHPASGHVISGDPTIAVVKDPIDG